MAGIGFPSTYVVKNGNGLGPRTLIIKLAGTDLTSADLASVVGYLTTSHEQLTTYSLLYKALATSQLPLLIWALVV
jgi:hypothetical protein